jgi:alcohol dehydrogenase class IV
MIAGMSIPSILRAGGGCFAQASEVLLRLKCRRPLIVTDPFMMKSQLVHALVAQMEGAELACAIFHETVPDPTTAVIDTGVRMFQSGGHDSLVSLGGGSPIDTAKAIGVLVANAGKMRDYKVPHPIPAAGPTHLAIPTTAGTGSEVSRFAAITDSETGEKMLVAGDTLIPTAALVDYELTLTMPPRLTADTGTDSLTHAIEAFVSRKANPLTDPFALAAMRTIWKKLPISFREPGNLAAREAMMLAATQAGFAFSNASVALVHGMSRPLGAQFHIPHGLSNAMLLPSVTAFSAEGALNRYAECARAMGLAQAADTDQSSVDQLIRGLYLRNAELEVPSPRQYGIAEDRYMAVIPTMAQQAVASGSPQNNPRIPTIDEIQQIYRQAWQ